jgi:hypothetical protein
MDFQKKISGNKMLQEWATGKSWEKIYNTCPRGEWLLYIFHQTNPNDARLWHLVNGYCAETVIQLMSDKRSKNAVEIAIKFGKGEATVKDLKSAERKARNAYKASCSFIYHPSILANNSAYESVKTNRVIAGAGGTAESSALAFRKKSWEYYYHLQENSEVTKNRLLTADICRKHLPFEIWNINL